MAGKKKWTFGRIVYETSNGILSLVSLSIGSYYTFGTDLFVWLWETTFGLSSAWTEWTYIIGGVAGIYHTIIWVNNLVTKYKWG